jgi:RNA polymerase sigma-70 factor (ECF subfamily)
VTVDAPPSDGELLARIVGQDARALRELYERHSPWISARLQRRCAERDVTVEALQDTFVAVWRSAASWDGRGEPAAWLWGIAIRRLVGVLRLRQRWAPTSVGGDVEVAAPGGWDADLADGIDLSRAVGSLDADLAAAIRATYLDGLSVAEASVLLGIPSGTVKTRVMRAKTQLRGALDER